MRACSCATVACATAGPPHTRRSSACTRPCGSPLSFARRPTRLLSSVRCSFSVRYSGGGGALLAPARASRARRAGLPGLPLLQQLAHLLGLENARACR